MDKKHGFIIFLSFIIVLIFSLHFNGLLICEAEASEFGLKAEFSDILIPTDNLNPGDEKSSVMTISIESENNEITSLPVWIKSKITANNPGDNGGDLDEVLRLKVMKGSEEIYSGRVRGFNSYVALGDVERDNPIDLDFYVNLPGEETTNYYQGSSIRVIWLLSTRYDEKGRITITKEVEGGDNGTVFTVNVYGPDNEEKLAGSVEIADGESKTIGLLEFGQYIFKEENKSGYTQVGTVDPVELTEEEPTQSVIVVNRQDSSDPTGSITFIKDVQDMDDNTIFEVVIYGPDSESVYKTVEISEDVPKTIKNVKYGKYTFEENGKAGYTQVGTVDPEDVKSGNKNPTVTFINKKDPAELGSITVYKYLEDENDDEVFEVKVYGPDSSTDIAKTIEIQMGEPVSIDNLVLGEYILEESYKSGYKRLNPVEIVNLETGSKDIDVTFENEPYDPPTKKRGSITVEKDVLDRNDNTPFEVRIYGPGNTERLMEIIEIKEGESVKVDNLILGRYTLIESNKSGYTQVNPEEVVDLSTGSRNPTVVFENKYNDDPSEKRGSIIINKDVLNIDDNTVFYVNVYGPDSDDKFVGRYEISEDSPGEVENLKFGEYALKEENNDDYRIGTVENILLTEKDRNKEATFINETKSDGSGGEVIVFEEFTPAGLPNTGGMPVALGFGGLTAFAYLVARLRRRKR
jgi:hypothetical protein